MAKSGWAVTGNPAEKKSSQELFSLDVFGHKVTKNIKRKALIRPKDEIGSVLKTPTKPQFCKVSLTLLWKIGCQLRFLSSKIHD